ncbi:MAG: SUMF1/EgtB/PvdO family nonheme iron enzyme [Nitrospinae bacterium]|nr:SUMF1/EgtB/PvdO family nonheme iron enzyme [Nitrospinota bacterium]
MKFPAGIKTRRAVALALMLLTAACSQWPRAGGDKESPLEIEEALAGVMVTVPGGCFDMGDLFSDGDSDETPVHRICLDGFLLDKYEAPQAAFAKVMKANPSQRRDCPHCPVEMVTWFEAKAYCEGLGKRLPTEAEWEYAAREGGKKVKFGTGKDELTRRDANVASRGPEPAGGYPPNALGLHDMAGNVWEWTADWYFDDYEAYRDREFKNPKGPSIGEFRVTRGGSWGLRASSARASARNPIRPHKGFNSVGFRCAK